MLRNVAILSDTHALFRPEVEQALTGCDHILHAGDIGSAAVLDRLKRIAPVTAVRGNMDAGAWARSLPVSEMLEIEGGIFYILHDRVRLDLDPSAAGIHMVVSGHTHRPEIFRKNGIIYLNPGSAGPRRFGHPVSIARVATENGILHPHIVEIDC